MRQFALSFVLSLIFLGENACFEATNLAYGLAAAAARMLERMSKSSDWWGWFPLRLNSIGIRLGGRLSSEYSFYDPKYVVTLLRAPAVVLYLRLAGTGASAWGAGSRLCIFIS